MNDPLLHLGTVGICRTQFNFELMTYCNIWVQTASILPKRNNGSLIHCYVWVRQMPILPKCNNESLIHCYAWVRHLHADGIQITCWCFHDLTFGTTEKITFILFQITFQLNINELGSTYAL